MDKIMKDALGGLQDVRVKETIGEKLCDLD